MDGPRYLDIICSPDDRGKRTLYALAMPNVERSLKQIVGDILEYSEGHKEFILRVSVILTLRLTYAKDTLISTKMFKAVRLKENFIIDLI